MNPWIHKLLQETEAKLVHLPADRALNACRYSNAQLKGYMTGYTFSSRADEILYFKVFKPRFMALQLKSEVLLSGERLDSACVASWFRNYYYEGHTKADPFYFTSRSCHKTDFELPIEPFEPAGLETYDKMVARLLAESWLDSHAAWRTAGIHMEKMAL